MAAINLFRCMMLVTGNLVFGQVNSIFGNDLYSGISSASVSPAQPYNNPNPWDINIAAEHISVHNDYLYISRQSVFGLRNAKIKSARPKTNITGDNTADILDFYNKDTGTYHLSSDFMGPSFGSAVTIKEKKFVFGLFSRLRAQSSAVRVDNYLKYSNQDLIEPDQYALQPLKLNIMNWAEFGLNASTQIFQYSDLKWIIGANVKYEMGFDAASVASHTPIRLTRTTDHSEETSEKTISASAYQIDANFATSYNFEKSRYEPAQKGRGFGVDFGLMVVDPLENDEGYRFKASLNVLDFGQVNFVGENHLFEGPQLVIVNNSNLENTRLESPGKVLRLLSSEVYGDENASFRGTDFSVGLPTSLHLGVSWNVGRRAYVHTNLIQRVPVFENSLRRSNFFSISYSVQNPALAYGASVSLHEYQAFRVGAYLRAGPVIIGS